MNTSKTVTYNTKTWMLIEQHAKDQGYDNINLAAEELIAAGAEVKKVKLK